MTFVCLYVTNKHTHLAARLSCKHAEKKTTRKQKLRFLSNCEILIKLLTFVRFIDTAAQSRSFTQKQQKPTSTTRGQREPAEPDGPDGSRLLSKSFNNTIWNVFIGEKIVRGH